MRCLAILALLTLAACGADGEPVQPQYSGNVTVGSGGVRVGGGVGVRQGPFSVGVGF
ncbi:hypothetical protein [Puniceibacterium sp. IMCC21224]|uniref:hypothetical protein n=1 Tax=Puniceibacterium sp. IMCC21224 TaxID=1618204 RepID=UPI00065D78FA|nr:hypothetical protein [Puniceibacterium sp. IMCC21224]KMK65910.1 hypothetical protein IMCC21224_11753 [Puniceibacterium sp. IMCC21224]